MTIHPNIYAESSGGYRGISGPVGSRRSGDCPVRHAFEYARRRRSNYAQHREAWRK